LHSLRKGNGYVNVDPNLVAGDQDIPLESLQVVSVLAKCLGPFPLWESKLLVAKESGYNMVHFTPIQVRRFNDVYITFDFKRDKYFDCNSSIKIHSLLYLLN